MELFNIITVSARPENILHIANNILSQKSDWEGNLYWYIIFDLKNQTCLPEGVYDYLVKNNNWIKFKFLKHEINKSSGGNHGKNLLIKEIEKGWIYQLDDDNELYPNFIKEISFLIKSNPERNIFCFWQYNRYTPKSKADLKAGVIDTAMYIFNKSACKNIDYPLYYGGDGKFLENLISENSESYYLHQEVLCWYNKLNEIELKNMNIDELSKLAIKYNTDKFQRHKYTKIYHELFKELRHKKIKLLELGIFYGSSLKMWREWFSEAEIIGIDNNIKIQNIPGVTILKSNTQTINICQDLNNQEFDIIIDDADHHPYQQLLTFWNTWPLLKKDGIYIIEDVQNLDQWGGHWGFLNPKIYDLRNSGGTYDSVMFVFRK
jgi:hypothetical protein